MFQTESPRLCFGAWELNRVPARQLVLSGVGVGAVLPLHVVCLTQRIVHDGVLTLEQEVPVEPLLLKQEGKPVAVIRPHVSEGDLVQWEPLRPHFCSGGQRIAGLTLLYEQCTGEFCVRNMTNLHLIVVTHVAQTRRAQGWVLA